MLNQLLFQVRIQIVDLLGLLSILYQLIYPYNIFFGADLVFLYGVLIVSIFILVAILKLFLFRSVVLKFLLFSAIVFSRAL